MTSRSVNLFVIIQDLSREFWNWRQLNQFLLPFQRTIYPTLKCIQLIGETFFSRKIISSFFRKWLLTISAPMAIEVFGNNTDSSISACYELSHLKSALFDFKLLKYSENSYCMKYGVARIWTWMSLLEGGVKHLCWYLCQMLLPLKALPCKQTLHMRCARRCVSYCICVEFVLSGFMPFSTLFQLYPGDSSCSLIHDPWVNKPVLG